MILALAKQQHVLLTTSREPTHSIRTLCRELSFTLPNVIRINRGKLGFDGILEKALELGAGKVVLISRWKGGFAKMEFFEVKEGKCSSSTLVVYVYNVKFRRDFENQVSKRRRINSVAIAFSSKETFELKVFENFMSTFFSIPVLSSEEVINGYDAIMKFFADSPNQVIVTFEILPEMIEIGPQMRISYLV